MVNLRLRTVPAHGPDATIPDSGELAPNLPLSPQIAVMSGRRPDFTAWSAVMGVGREPLYAKHTGAGQRWVPSGWRRSMFSVLEHHYTQLLVLLLVLADLIAVFGEIVLMHVCEEPEHIIHQWETSLHWISVSILIVFALQQVALFVCLGVGYFRHAWYCLDAVIVVVALVLELAVHTDEGGEYSLAAHWSTLCASQWRNVGHTLATEDYVAC